jgi:hypothetical protein
VRTLLKFLANPPGAPHHRSGGKILKKKNEGDVGMAKYPGRLQDALADEVLPEKSGRWCSRLKSMTLCLLADPAEGTESLPPIGCLEATGHAGLAGFKPGD